MEKFKKIIQSETIIDVLIIIAITVILTIISGFLSSCFLADRGREFLFPQAILNGLVPYKDITMVYFPLSYYINAFVFKLFGVSFNSLIIFAACFATFFMIIYYLTAKEFINRKISILLSVFIILSCIFSMHDLMMYPSSYSFARTYGAIGGVSCLFFFLKLYNTDNIKYGYLAAFFASFSVSNKIEFAPVLLLFVAGFILYKRLKITEYIKLFLILMFFPLLTVMLLYLGGVSLSDIISASEFFFKFSSTAAMKGYQTTIGAIPEFQPGIVVNGLISLSITILLSILYCFLDKKFNNKIILPLMLIIAIPVCHFMRNTADYWLELQWFIIILAIIFGKKIIKDKRILLLIIAALSLCLRTIFKTDLHVQGVYSFPLLILSTIVLFQEYISKYISKISIEKFITFFLIVLIGTYSIQQAVRIKYNRYPLKTNKGTLYMPPERVKIFGNTIEYIENNIPKDASLLVLPEGPIFNFILDRKTDMHCFMMDRFYHDAYGEEKALSLIKNANNDYIIIIEGFELFKGKGYEFLYAPNASLSADYIFENYTEVYQETEDNNPKNIITIYKKNDD